MRSRSQPRRLRDGPRVVLGAAGIVGWFASVALVADSLSDAVRTTGDSVRGPSTLRDVAVAWLLVPVAILGLVVATLLVPVVVVRGALSLRALLKERRQALELRHEAAGAAGERAVFVSYRAARHGPDAQAVSQALQAAGRPAWLDAERGTLPTHLFFVDHVLEDAVRSARAVVVLHQAGDDDGSYEETRLDHVDVALATGLRWILFAPFAIAAIMSAVLIVPALALLAMLPAAPGPRRAWMVPPTVRAQWWRSLSGADIGRRTGERWQAWEQRLAALYGLPTVGVAVVDDPSAGVPDVDVVLVRATIDRDVRARLLPALEASKPDPTASLALAGEQLLAARAAARSHPFRTLWRAGGGGAGESGVAALVRRVAGEGDTARAFERDGYAVLGRFLEPRELAALRDEVDQALAAPRDPSCERPHNTLVPLRWDDAVVDRVLSDGARSRRLAAVLDADDLRWISGYLTLKEPGSPALWWHQDWWCWDHPISFAPRAAQVALLCYLTATDDERAALRVLPGSHRERTALHAALPEAHARAAEELDLAHTAMTDHADQVTLRLAAGDAVLMDYRLLHGTHPNRSAARRDGVLLTFAPSWRTLPPEIRGHLICHPALPSGGFADRPWAERLLPSYDGPRADLPLNRAAFPAE
jgi:hypothetical protein